MFKKIFVIAIGISVSPLIKADEAWERVSDWTAAKNSSSGNISLTIDQEAHSAHIQFVCGGINIAHWAPGTEMDGLEAGGPVILGPGTPVKVAAKYHKNGLRISVDEGKEGTWLLEPGKASNPILRCL